MSLNHHQQHQLHRIETGLLRSEPQLTTMPDIFGRLSAGAAMPAWQQVPSSAAGFRNVQARWYSRRGPFVIYSPFLGGVAHI
jgi:hypothetical protein